jgi:hypothetical protein
MTLKRMIVIVVTLLTATGAAAEVVRSGAIEVDTDQLKGVSRESAAMPKVGGNLHNLLVNSTFERGDLWPWDTSNWVISTNGPLHGSYCAEDFGNYYIRQDFDPISASQITHVLVWMRQPDAQISAIDLYYGASDFDEVIYYPGSDWTLIDVTPQLRTTGSLIAIRIWGYSGTGTQMTYIDNVMIFAGSTVPFPLATDTWDVDHYPNFWNAGDTVYGQRDLPTGPVTRADVALKLSRNILDDDLGGYVDLAFRIDGATVGILRVTEDHGLGYVFGSFAFGAESPPRP